MLGSLCEDAEPSLSWNAHVGDQSIELGGDDAKLLLLGFYTQAPGDDGHDHASDIRYAAYVVLDPPVAIPGDGWETEREIMRSWERGEPLTGEIVTQRAADLACGTEFIGSATLVWRDTTLTLRWAAALPC
jgi:hypothetical protein